MSPATVTSPTNSARTVVGLIGFAVLFSLIGNEIQIANGTKSNKLANGLDKGATIIIGGFVAAALLTALTGAGEAGRKFAVGLSVVTMVTATLVYGGPVWVAIQNAEVSGSSTGGTKPTGNTAATSPSTPTTGVSTAAALAQAA
jgi:hypothetical protein